MIRFLLFEGLSDDGDKLRARVAPLAFSSFVLDRL